LANSQISFAVLFAKYVFCIQLRSKPEYSKALNETINNNQDMAIIKKPRDFFLTQAKKEKTLQEIIAYFREEKDEEIGLIAAEEILDFFLDTIGSAIYNKGIEEAGQIVREGFGNLEVNLDALLKK
jgi:uncharacterized protein (DUF2164 family)